MSMTAELPDKIVNIDIVNLCNLIVSELEDLGNSTSATMNSTTNADIKRAKDFHARWQRKYTTDAGLPELDMPKYTPRKTDFPQWPELKNETPLQNKDVQDLINNWQMLFVEMAWSDSRERPAGFFKADQGRITPVLAKISANIKDMEESPENDLPDSTDQPVHDLK